MGDYDAFEIEDDFIRSLVYSLSTENVTAAINWFDNNTSICEFVGIQCNTNGYVSIIDLSSFGLMGVLPRSFWPLSHLERLTLRNNLLSGPMPSLFPETLAQLSFERNLFQGTIPTFQFPGNMTTPSMQRLVLSDNGLEGTIPTDICKLPSLRKLNLSRNPQLTGMLPSCLSELSHLTGLQVHETRLLGPVHERLCPNQLGMEDSTGSCEKFDFCLDGYHRQSNAGVTTCEPCSEPSNILDSDYCAWYDPNVDEHDTTWPPSTAPTVRGEPSTHPSYQVYTSLPSFNPSVSPSNLSETPTSEPSVFASEGPTFGNSHGGLSSDGKLEPSHSPTKIPSSEPTTMPTVQNSILPLYSPEPTWQPYVSIPPTMFSGSVPPYLDPNSVEGSHFESGTRPNHPTPLFLRCFIGLAFVVCTIAVFWLRRRRRRGPIPNVTVICWESQDHATILDLEARPSSEPGRRQEPEFGMRSTNISTSKLFPIHPPGHEASCHEYRGISPRIANKEYTYVTSPEGVDVEFRSNSCPSSASTLGIHSPLADEISSEESDLFELEEFEC